MKTHLARREFLRFASRSLAFLGTGSLLVDTVLSSFVRRAFAQTQNLLNPTGYYIHLSLRGGPPRWYFDLPLTPMGRTNQNFEAGNFGTKFQVVSNEVRTVYAAEKHSVGGKTIYLPPVWKMDLKTQKFSDLLPHTLFIRGMDMEIDNHALSNSRQTAPIIGGLSLHGVVADGANRPIPCVSDGVAISGRNFKSKKGFSASLLNFTETTTVNPVSTLLAPFRDFLSSSSLHNGVALKLQEQAFTQFEQYAQINGITSSSLTKMYDNAMELIHDNILKIADDWNPTVEKYRNIVAEALYPKKGSLPGLFDTNIKVDSGAAFRFSPNTTIKLSDLRDIISDKTQAPRMAENFALAELLIDKTTSTMSLNFDGLTQAQSGIGTFDIIHDQHFIGSLVSTLGTTLFFRAFAGCLTQYVSTLKENGLFDKTVLHISAEFNRRPHVSGRGSDHAFQASNATLISGMIKNNAVIGNIQKSSLNSDYPGTFGVARSFSTPGYNRPIQVNDVARTIAAMLGADTEDIVTNGRTLLKPENGIWVPVKEEANNA